MPSTPTYRRIADQIRDQIARGALVPGDRLPTEPELERIYGAGRNTIRSAVAELVAQGLVETRRRKGTVVCQQQSIRYLATVAEQADRAPAGSEARDAFYEEVTAQGRVPSQDFSMVIEPVTPDIAARLRVRPGDLVVARACLRYVDDQPWSEQVSYYPMDVSEAAGLTAPRDIPEGTVRAMAKAGFLEVGKRDELSSRMPTPEEARALEMRPGVPLIVYYRTTWDRERTLRCSRTLFPADRNTIEYELGDLSAYYADDDEPAA